MYLYYLIGFKIDQCEMTCHGDAVSKDNSFDDPKVQDGGVSTNTDDPSTKIQV